MEKLFCQTPVTSKWALNSGLQGNLSGNTDKQHDRYEKVNKIDSLQPSGCNSYCAMVVISEIVIFWGQLSISLAAPGPNIITAHFECHSVAC